LSHDRIAVDLLAVHGLHQFAPNDAKLRLQNALGSLIRPRRSAWVKFHVARSWC
jgi:hypothetical protein